MAEFSPKLKEALSLVQKPGRYTGGEPGCTYKDKANVDVRMAFCFPDTYEIGMSFLGEKILYELLNRHENWWCERAFMPWVDMKEQMERLHIPLYCLESKDPLTDFDIVGFSLEYELCYTNILAMLDLAGIPLRAADRDERWPLIISGGLTTRIRPAHTTISQQGDFITRPRMRPVSHLICRDFPLCRTIARHDIISRITTRQTDRRCSRTNP